MAANVAESQCDDELLDYKGGALFLGVRRGTLQVWVCTGRYGVPYLKIGRLVRFRKSALAAWMQSRERGGAQ
jgi:excisionase family DNA binding protein